MINIYCLYLHPKPNRYVILRSKYLHRDSFTNTQRKLGNHSYPICTSVKMTIKLNKYFPTAELYTN